MGWCSNLNITPEAALYDISYQNLLLFSSATPYYDDEKEYKWDPKLDANNPDNFKSEKDEEIIR